MFNSKSIALIFGVLVMSFAISYLILAWQEPTQEPPGGNVATPINVGTSPQAKAGRFTATEFYDYNDPSFYLNPSGNSNLGGNLTVGGSGNIYGGLTVGFDFEVDQTGIPSWQGKRFNGWVQMTNPTTQNVCMPADSCSLNSGGACISKSCTEKCSNSGCTSVGSFYDWSCEEKPCVIPLSGDNFCRPDVSPCGVLQSKVVDCGNGATIEVWPACLCSCPGASAPFWVPSFQ